MNVLTGSNVMNSNKNSAQLTLFSLASVILDLNLGLTFSMSGGTSPREPSSGVKMVLKFH